MFSFFRKKSPFTVVVKEFDHSRFAAGMEVTTARMSPHSSKHSSPSGRC